MTEEPDVVTQGGATFRPIMKCQAPRRDEASDSKQAILYSGHSVTR
jgi:hypothetical protein